MGAMSDVMIADPRPAETPEEREFSVLIAPDLRALYREARAGRETSSPREEAPLPEAIAVAEEIAPPPPSGPEPHDVAAPEPSPFPEDDAPLSNQRLRRDGERPLLFRGMLIVAGSVESQLASGIQVRQSLALWALPDGTALLSIILEPVEAQALRPVHRSTVFPGAEALGSVLESHDPSEAFPDVPFMTALAIDDIRRDASQLRRDFLKLAGLALGAVPNGREIEKEPTQ